MHVVQVMDDVVLHVSFVHVFNICCNEHIWYVHVTLHVVMLKKLNVDRIFAACNIYYQERGGWAGAHKIVGV